MHSHQALGYECPEAVASAAESRDVAKAVNGADDKDSLLSLGMSKTMATKIIKSRERQRREFERVEQFLDLDQMTTRKLESEVNKIIVKMKMKREGELKSETQTDIPESADSETKLDSKGVEKKLSRMIIPAVDPGVWEDVNTVVGIKMNLESASYAKLTKEMELLDWNVIKLLERSAGKSRANYEFTHILNAAITASQRESHK